jgi:hypothetical protein
LGRSTGRTRGTSDDADPCRCYPEKGLIKPGSEFMQTERGKLFDEKEPELSDDEVSKAYEDGKIAASFKGKPVVTSSENIGFIAVKFAFHDGSHGTMLLDYFAARVLRSLIDSVDEIGWKTAAAKPGETRH